MKKRFLSPLLNILNLYQKRVCHCHDLQSCHHDRVNLFPQDSILFPQCSMLLSQDSIMRKGDTILRYQDTIFDGTTY